MLYFRVGVSLFKFDASGVGLVAGYIDPHDLTAVGETLYFRANGVDQSGVDVGVGLFKLDAAGISLVVDPYPGTVEIDPLNITSIGGALYFSAPGGVWKFDEYGLNNVWSSTESWNLIAVGDVLYFSPAGYVKRKNSSSNKYLPLYKLDVNGVSLIDRIDFDSTSFTVVGNALYFSGWSYLLKYDENNDLVTIPNSVGGRIRNLTAVGDRLYFTVNDGVYGEEIWRTDGTEAGTEIAFDLVPGYGSSLPENLTAIGNKLYFSADDGVVGQEPWVYIDRSASTRICDIPPVIFGGNCSGEAIAASLLDIDAYVASDFGKTLDANGKPVYKNLRLVSNLGQSGLPFIATSPCAITVNANSSIVGSDVTLHARQGLNLNWSADIDASGEVCLLSDKQNALLNGANTVNADTLAIRGNKKAVVGFQSAISVNGDSELVSTGTGETSQAKIGNKTTVTAEHLTMKADNIAELAFEASVSVTGDLAILSGDEPTSETRLTNRSSVQAGNSMRLNSGSTTTIGFHSTITAGNHLEVNAKTEDDCAIASITSTSYSSKSGNCSNKLP